MLNHYFEQRIEINATSMSKVVKENAKKMYTLSGDDSASVKRMIQILKPLKPVTTTLCVEKSPTVALIYTHKMSDDDSLCSSNLPFSKILDQGSYYKCSGKPGVNFVKKKNQGFVLVYYLLGWV